MPCQQCEVHPLIAQVVYAMHMDMDMEYAMHMHMHMPCTCLLVAKVVGGVDPRREGLVNEHGQPEEARVVFVLAPLPRLLRRG